jgi:glyoxylase-like metal-dependent hydrolase (beta-lactamase superfamily II)
MATQYITRKTSQLYEFSTGGKREMVLIFGDEVETTGPPVNGRVPVEFRGRPGFIQKSHLGQKPVLELYFIDVGQGDSTFIVTPGRKKIVIDGGLNRRALGFLVWKYRLDKPGPPIDIDLLVLTHADEDHLNGLVSIIDHPRIRVHQIVHSGIATFRSGVFGTRLGNLDPSRIYLETRHSSLDDLAGLDLTDSFASWRKAIVDEGASYTAVDSADGSLDVGDPEITVDVIGPRLDVRNGQPVFRWYKNDSHTINGHSVVLRLNYGEVSILFSGDLNVEGAKHLLAEPALVTKMDAHVFKAPHHGSHEFHLPFLEAVRPQISVISSGDDPDHGHPRAVFVGGVGSASRSRDPLVFSTEIAAAFTEVGSETDLQEDVSLENADFRTAEANVRARQLFKRRLHGMINVRTDGQELYAARRVASGYWWESYGPLTPAERPAG